MVRVIGARSANLADAVNWRMISANVPPIIFLRERRSGAIGDPRYQLRIVLPRIAFLSKMLLDFVPAPQSLAALSLRLREDALLHPSLDRVLSGADIARQCREVLKGW
jgi:hypothetical protein